MGEICGQTKNKNVTYWLSLLGAFTEGKSGYATAPYTKPKSLFYPLG